MTTGERRRLAVLVSVGIVVVAVVVAALVGVSRSDKQNEVAEANQAALRYSSALEEFAYDAAETFNTSAAAAVKSGRFDQLGLAIERLVKRLPTLETAEVSSYGAANSSSYQLAEDSVEAVSQQFVALAEYVETEATVTANFVTAGLRPLRTNLGELGVPTRLASGEPVRELVIKPFKKMLAAFQSTAIPEGKEPLASDTVKALKEVINRTRSLAAKLDKHQSAAVSTAELVTPLIARYEDLRKSNRKAVEDMVEAAVQSIQPDRGLLGS